jgi:hypothetical protein
MRTGFLNANGEAVVGVRASSAKGSCQGDRRIGGDGEEIEPRG